MKKLTKEEKSAACYALARNDSFTRGNVTMFMLLPGEYCVQKTVGTPGPENRVITKSWSEALSSFEVFQED